MNIIESVARSRANEVRPSEIVPVSGKFDIRELSKPFEIDGGVGPDELDEYLGRVAWGLVESDGQRFLTGVLPQVEDASGGSVDREVRGKIGRAIINETVEQLRLAFDRGDISGYDLEDQLGKVMGGVSSTWSGRSGAEFVPADELLHRAQDWLGDFQGDESIVFSGFIPVKDGNEYVVDNSEPDEIAIGAGWTLPMVGIPAFGKLSSQQKAFSVVLAGSVIVAGCSGVPVTIPSEEAKPTLSDDQLATSQAETEKALQEATRVASGENVQVDEVAEYVSGNQILQFVSENIEQLNISDQAHAEIESLDLWRDRDRVVEILQGESKDMNDQDKIAVTTLAALMKSFDDFVEVNELSDSSEHFWGINIGNSVDVFGSVEDAVYRLNPIVVQVEGGSTGIGYIWELLIPRETPEGNASWGTGGEQGKIYFIQALNDAGEPIEGEWNYWHQGFDPSLPFIKVLARPDQATEFLIDNSSSQGSVEIEPPVVEEGIIVNPEDPYNLSFVNIEVSAAMSDEELLAVAPSLNPETYRISEIESLSATEVIRAGGLSMVVYRAEDGYARLAWVVERGQVMPVMVGVEVEGMAQPIILTNPDYVEQHDFWYMINPDVTDAERVVTNFYHRMFAMAAFGQIGPGSEDEPIYDNTMPSLSKLPLSRIPGISAYANDISDMPFDMRVRVAGEMEKWFSDLLTQSGQVSLDLATYPVTISTEKQFVIEGIAANDDVVIDNLRFGKSIFSRSIEVVDDGSSIYMKVPLVGDSWAYSVLSGGPLVTIARMMAGRELDGVGPMSGYYASGSFVAYDGQFPPSFVNTYDMTGGLVMALLDADGQASLLINNKTLTLGTVPAWFSRIGVGAFDDNWAMVIYRPGK